MYGLVYKNRKKNETETGASLIIAAETRFVLFNRSNISGDIHVKKDWLVSSHLDRGS